MTPGKFQPMAKKKKTVGKNDWAISGKVVKKTEGNKETKAGQEAKKEVRLLIEVPAKNPKYTTRLWLKAFNSTKDPSKNVADQVISSVQEGQNYYFSGFFTSRDYVGADGKDKHTEDKIIWQYEPITEDSDEDENPFE